MGSRATLAILLAGVLFGSGIAKAASPVGYWPFNGNLNDVAGTASGTFHGGTPSYQKGQVGQAVFFDGVAEYVSIPSPTNPAMYTIAAWVKPARTSDAALVTRTDASGPVTSWSHQLRIQSGAFHHYLWVGAQRDVQGTTTIVPDTWYHVAIVAQNNGPMHLYVNGKEEGTSISTAGTLWATGTQIYVGSNSGGGFGYFQGLVDDLRVYTEILPLADIQSLMKSLSSAVVLSPADGATDVPRDAALSWTAGAYPATHDVYLGTVAADVNSASRTATKGVLASKSQADTTFTPASVFAYGQTYYWRIDEVNKSADGTIYRGGLWSFTAEPYAYPITKITATASSSQPGMGPENTINGSGLAGDLHGTDNTTMWLSAGTPPNWIQYQFDKAYKVYDLKVWNSNQLIEGFLGFGAKDVKVEYSTDGATWTALANVPQFARAPGVAGYAANTTVSFGGVMAKYVKLTINSTWGGLGTITGLSEVRFSYVPVQARSPAPATGATNQGITTTLSWRPGREAGSHKVFFGTDPNAVANGTVAAKTVTAHAFDPGALLFGMTYYWRVDEVNATTYPGDVWSFTTQEFAAVDDFESYNDDKNRIYDSWIDGLTDGKSGSTVGYMAAPFAETTIVHGGKQSMPLAYDNSKSPFYSETTRDLGTAQDWTGNGATHLDLWFRGYGALTVAATVTNGALTLTGDGTDIWNNADDFTFAYKTLTGDGTIVARVVSVGTGTNTWAKGGVMIRGDLTAGSIFVDMVLTGSAGNGSSFQYRLTANGGCANVDATAVLPVPYWVKLDRKGNVITGSVSADGKTWTQQGTPQAITLTGPVDVGICVCAHQAGEYRTMQFDNITTTGNVTGTWQGAQINSTPHNDPAGLYVVVQDSAGKSKLAVNMDPAATNASVWTQWTIPLSDLTAAGVKTTAVKKLTVGVGDKSSPKAGGTGMVFIDDIGFGHPVK